MKKRDRDGESSQAPASRKSKTNCKEPSQPPLTSCITTMKIENPRKTSCDVCRSLKRKCNGTFKLCKKPNPDVKKAQPFYPPAAYYSPPYPYHYPYYYPPHYMYGMPAAPTHTSFIRHSLDPVVSFLESISVSYALDGSRPPSSFADLPEEFSILPPELLALSNSAEESGNGQTQQVHMAVLEKSKSKISMLIEVVQPAHIGVMTPFTRYSLCAMSSLLSDPPAPHVISKTYYKMAKGLITRAFEDSPDIDTLQSMLVLYSAAIALGDCISAKWMLDVALRIATYLNLNKDEGWLLVKDVPYGSVDSLQELEKRRRCWEACYFLDKMSSVYYGHCSFFSEPAAKPPCDPMFIKSRLSLMELVDVAFEVAEATRVPLTNFDIVREQLPVLRTSEALLLEWYESQPEEVRQGMEGMESFRSETAFMNFLWNDDAIPFRDEQFMAEGLLANFIYHTIWCILYRPRLALGRMVTTEDDYDDKKNILASSILAAERSAECIFTLGEKLLGKRPVYLRFIHPTIGFSFITAFYVFLELSSQEGVDPAYRTRCIQKMEILVKLVKKISFTWESFTVWTPVVKRDFTRVKNAVVQ
ncbi:hypothetical protein HDU97_009373 [Phlyctochytrium planicorne]|nr:hypothetical protein HDU97_009373 [Phlyctochytrium planicorne]